MSIRGAIFSRLSTWQGLVDLVGHRVWPNELPQEPQFPAVVFQRISTPRIHTHDQAGGAADARFQFTCYAEGGDASEAIADQVRLAFDGFRGTLDGTRIDRVLSQNQISGKDPDRPGIHREVIDLKFFHAE